jgi:hypothetical protein
MLVKLKSSCVRADEGMRGDEADESREYGSAAVLGPLDDGWEFAGGWVRAT